MMSRVEAFLEPAAVPGKTAIGGVCLHWHVLMPHIGTPARSRARLAHGGFVQCKDPLHTTFNVARLRASRVNVHRYDQPPNI